MTTSDELEYNELIKNLFSDYQDKFIELIKDERDRCDECNININDIGYITRGNGYDSPLLCSNCYNNMDIKNVHFNKEEWWHATCDCCFKHIIGDALELFEKAHLCNKCSKTYNFKDIFLKFDINNNNNNIIYTDGGREEILIYNNNIELQVPDIVYKEYEFEENRYDSITESMAHAWFDIIFSLVKMPNIEFNCFEWRILTNLESVPCFDAMCCFAIRCVKNNHQIASIVMDNHGRVAMDIVFENIDEYLKEKKLFEKQLRPEEERLKCKELLEKKFTEKFYAENEHIMNATDSFSVYYRLKLGLSLYYG